MLLRGTQLDLQMVLLSIFSGGLVKDWHYEFLQWIIEQVKFMKEDEVFLEMVARDQFEWILDLTVDLEVWTWVELEMNLSILMG